MCFLLRSGSSLIQPLMHLCLHGVGLHTFHSCLDDYRAVIIEPTDVTVALTPPDDQPQNRGGLQVSYQRYIYFVISRASPVLCSSFIETQDLVAPRAALEVRTSKIRTHFSYTDSLLFLSLLDSLREQTAYAFGSTGTSTNGGYSTSPDAVGNETSFGMFFADTQR